MIKYVTFFENYMYNDILKMINQQILQSRLQGNWDKFLIFLRLNPKRVRITWTLGFDEQMI